MKQGWEIKTLGDVLEVLRNGVNCKQDKKGFGDKISRIESISNADFDINKVGFTTLSISDKGKYRLAKGDILFSHINSPIHVGKTALFNSDEEVYHGVNLLLMRPKPFLNGSYFEHFLKFLFQNGYWRGLCKQSVNQASVNQQDINKVEIPFPPLPEQRRIVAILDEAFAAIAKAKANAEQNLKNAKELFESYLQSVFENGNWGIKTIQEVCAEIFAGGDAPKDNFSLEKNEKYQIPIYANAVKDKGLYGYTDIARVNKPSITISARGSGTGHTEIRFVEYLPIVRLIVLIPNLSLINLEFLKYSIDNLEILRSGSAIPQLTVPMIKEYNLALPLLTDQEKIVQKLDALSAETKKLEAIYQRKIEDLEELKKSVLAKAFKGEL